MDSRPYNGSALWFAGIFVCGWQLKLCDPLVSFRGAARDEALYKSTFTLLYFTLHYRAARDDSDGAVSRLASKKTCRRDVAAALTLIVHLLSRSHSLFAPSYVTCIFLAR